MDKSLAKYFGLYKNIKTDFFYVPPVEENVESVDDLKPLLDEIFSCDPVTGMPRGDIAYFLSKDGNPQVKAFIESVLFAQRSDIGMNDPSKIDDDLIVEYSRKDNESVADYAKRLSQFRDTATEQIKKYEFDRDNPQNE